MSVRGTRWGKKLPGTPEEARKLLLEATARVVERRGMARTTFADIAAEAGVTRPTVYKHYASKEAIVEAYLLSIAGPYVEHTVAALGRVVPASREPRDRLFASIGELVRTMPDQPWFGPFFQGESAVVTTSILLGSDRLLEEATRLLEPVLARAGRTDLPPRAILETAIRIVLSYALVPASDPDALSAALRLVAAALDGPSIERPVSSTIELPVQRTQPAPADQPANGMRSRSERTRSRAKGTRGAEG